MAITYNPQLLAFSAVRRMLTDSHMLTKNLKGSGGGGGGGGSRV